MKALLIVFISGLLSSYSFAADDTDLPLAAKNVISSMERTVSTAQKKAVADLKVIMKKEAQAGRMDKVTLLNNIIKDLEAEIDKPTIRNTNSKYDSKIIGKWKMPMVKYEIEFKKGNRYSGKFGDNVNFEGTWYVKDKKLIVKHPFENAFDTFDLPPKREMAGGRNVYKLYGHTEKGEGRVLIKAD